MLPSHSLSLLSPSLSFSHSENCPQKKKRRSNEGFTFLPFFKLFFYCSDFQIEESDEVLSSSHSLDPVTNQLSHWRSLHLLLSVSLSLFFSILFLSSLSLLYLSTCIISPYTSLSSSSSLFRMEELLELQLLPEEKKSEKGNQKRERERKKEERERREWCASDSWLGPWKNLMMQGYESWLFSPFLSITHYLILSFSLFSLSLSLVSFRGSKKRQREWERGKKWVKERTCMQQDRRTERSP